jgi:DNA transposition AAA+ family ATPase
MSLAAGFEDQDYEDELPQGQEPIITSSVERILTLLAFVMNSHEMTGYTCNGVVTGAAGLGKTIATQAFQGQNPVRTHTGLPSCVRVKVGMKSTAQALARDITQTLNVRPKAKRINDSTNEAIDALRRSDLHLLLIDEADGLDVMSFELLRRIHDRTGCPIVLVGLPQIYQVISQYEKYESRIGMFVSFPPLTEDEVLDHVLPNLRIKGWAYDRAKESDRIIGKMIWHKVQPSFRKLRVVLTNASQFAQMVHHPHITAEDIRLAMDVSLRPHRPKSRREEDTPSYGPYEQASEERRKGRESKEKRKAQQQEQGGEETTRLPSGGEDASG